MSCKVGVFSSDGNEELSRFDAGWFALLTATWDMAAKTSQEQLDLTASWVHNDKDENANAPQFTDIGSVVVQWEIGRGFSALGPHDFLIKLSGSDQVFTRIAAENDHRGQAPGLVPGKLEMNHE